MTRCLTVILILLLSISAGQLLPAAANKGLDTAFEYNELTLPVGMEIPLARQAPTLDSYSQWSWQSDNDQVVTITAAGVVKGVSPGTAVITATAGDLTVECAVSVVAAVVPGSIKYSLAKKKSCLCIPKEILVADMALDIKQDKMLLTIPRTFWSGALEKPALDNIIIEIEEYLPTIPRDLVAASKAYSFNLKVGDARVDKCPERVSLQVLYNPSRVRDPSKLAIHCHDPVADSWDPLPSVIDSEACTVTTEISPGSSFALFLPVNKTGALIVYILLGALGVNSLFLIYVLHKQKQAQALQK